MNQCQPIARIILATTLWCGAFLGTATGQPPAPPPQIDAPIQYLGPDTYILVDAEGRPQPVLGMSYEEFVEAWKELQKVDADAEEPRFTLDELHVTGDALDGHAAVKVEIALRANVAGRLAVPLGMARAILREQPRWETVGEAAPAREEPTVVYDPQAGGYVLHMHGQPGERHRLAFQMLVPLERNGNETSLRMNWPRAMVSRMSLTVPTPIVDATATEGSLLAKESIEGGSTHLKVEGLVGDFHLSWSTADRNGPELATVLSAVGAVSIAIDGHGIRSDARLTVRSFGGSFDRFRVRLPAGAKLIQDHQPDAGAARPNYRVLVTDQPPEGAGTQIVTVELPEKQLGPVDVALSVEQPLGLPAAERPVELSGFEVLGAVRQFGDVAVRVADDWQLRWEAGPYVRQVERDDLTVALAAEPLTAAFQYDRQPWSLTAQLAPRPMVVHVTPKFRLELDANEARLHTRLSYQVPGARTFEFRVQLRGWELTPDPIESGGLVDRDGVLVNRDGVLELPLAQASSRRAEISFNLRRAVPRDTTELELPLPIPEADSVSAAELAVAAAAEIELLPNMSRSRGLSPTPITGRAPLAATDNGWQTFRYRTFSAEPVFAAQRTVRPAEVTADLDTTLRVDGQQFRATQEIACLVRYQPLSELAFDVPAGWTIVGDHLEVVSPGPGAQPQFIPAIAAGDGDSPVRQVRFALPQPQLGHFSVRVQYEAAETAAPLDAGLINVKLPQPARAILGQQRVIVRPSPEFSVSLRPFANSSWRPATDAQPNDGTRSELTLVANGPQTELPLVIEPASSDRPHATTVARAWLQTWQAGNTIQDRAAIRFRTAGPRVTIELPPLITAQEVEVLVDGELARVSARQEGRLMVELPEPSAASESGATTHTLELRYRRQAASGWLTNYEFTPPQLVGTSALAEVYWQVVLPGDLHVVRSPLQLVPVDPWQWLEVFFGRKASKTQAELETWVGASSQLAPTAAQNAYLFSGLAPMASMELWTAPRWLIVLAASGIVLALACLFMYVPAIRRGWIGILAAAVVAGTAVAYPRPAVLLGQAALVGLVLAIVALILQRWLARPVPRPSSTAGSTNLRAMTSYRPEPLVAPLVTSTSGTPTAPLAVPDADR